MAAADREAIAELLDRRASAVLSGDRKVFASTLGRSSDFFRARQMDLFEAMQALPLQKYELNAAWTRLGNLARPRDRGRYGAAEDVAIPLTQERYRLSGDGSDVVEDLFFSFVKRDGRWGIESDTDLEDIGFLSARHLWDFGPVLVSEQQRYLIISRSCPGCLGLSESMVRVAEEGFAQARRYWSGPVPQQVTVLVPGSGQELERLVQATFDLVDFIAFTVSFIDTRNELAFSGPRIVLGETALAGEPVSRSREIMAHELLHLITRSSSGPFVPLWVEEGFADYVGSDADPAALEFLRQRVAAGSFDRRLPADHEFTTGDHDSIYAAYQESHSAIRFMAEEWGIDAVNRFYRTLGSARVAPGTSSFHVDRASQRAMGIGSGVFERRWARWVTDTIL